MVRECSLLDLDTPHRLQLQVRVKETNIHKLSFIVLVLICGYLLLSVCILGLKPGTEYGIGVTAVRNERESLPTTANSATGEKHSGAAVQTVIFLTPS